MALEHLAYISHAAAGMSKERIRAILEQSRRNNVAQRITGHLQCHGGCFFQILEGPAPALDELLARLRADPRHADLRVLYRESLDRRQFADWSMGFGPCQSDPAQDQIRQRMEDLYESAPTSAHRVLGVFFALLETETPEAGDDPVRQAGQPPRE